MNKLKRLTITAAVCAAAVAAHGLSLSKEYLKPSEGAVVPGEWNRNFDDALEMADARNIPLVVFSGGLSCGACESLQLACLTDEFLDWQAKKKLLMVFTTTDSAATRFARSDDSEGYPYIAVYWNREGVVPEKGSKYYITFTGRNGLMPGTGSTLAAQFIKSIELVAAAYPYEGGDFLYSKDSAIQLEVETGYAAGRKVAVPLVRGDIPDGYVNKIVCGGKTGTVTWNAHETEKLVEVEIPAGLSAGQTVALTLLSADGSEYSTSLIRIVEKQPNTTRNPAWLGEPFEAGEWTVDYDNALARMKNGEFDYTLLYFSGAMWCPHCQGLDEGVLEKAEFRSWCETNNVALVEFDNPRRSDSSSPANDYQIRDVSGAPPALLRYAIGKNNYLNREESGASYMSRKGIAVGDINTPGTAEYILQRNRRLGYEWGEGTYCAPGGGRTGYPTIILLKSDGTVAGRFKRFANGYDHPIEENMARLDELLKLADGEGESSCYPQTTTNTLEVGRDAVTAHLQINAPCRYFKLVNLPAGRVDFLAVGGSVDNPVQLTVVRQESGAFKTLAEGSGTLEFETDGEGECFLKVEAFRESRAYGRNTDLAVSVSSSVVLLPVEKTRTFDPDGRKFSISLLNGARYRLEGFAQPLPDTLVDEGDAPDGGRYFKAVADGLVELSAAGQTVRYQKWNPGSVSFDFPELVVFEFEKQGTVSVSRKGGSSGRVSVKVCVAGGTAVNGVRYVWNDETTFSWEDGESGMKKMVFALKDTGKLEPNESFLLRLCDASGSAAESVSAETCEVTLTDVDTPILPKQEYEVSMYATIDAVGALEPQKAYNVVDGTKVSFKKESGKLPSGVKLAYEDGAVSLSGAAKKPGTYHYSFRMRQKQDGKTVYGPVITVSFTVLAADDVINGGNKILNRSVKTALPLFEEEDGTLVARGIIELTMSKKNKITAKYSGLEKKTVTFRGFWSDISEGFATAELESKGRYLSLSLDPDGAMSVEYEDSATGTVLMSGRPLYVGIDDFAVAFKGKYTVSLRESGADDAAGWSYIVVKSISSEGKASWSGVLANGQSVSDSAYITLDADGYALLPVFKRKSKDYLAAALMLKPYGADLSYPRAVRLAEGTIARWEHTSEPYSVHDCEARGSWHDPSASLDELCFAQFAQTRLAFYALVGGWESGRYGKPVDYPDVVAVDILEDDIELTEKNRDLKLKYSRSTGIFSGSLKVYFEGKKVTASFKGVVLPGWHDCGCEVVDLDDPFHLDASQPFAAGAAWISDKVNGKTVKRGFPVIIDIAD